MWSLLDTRDPLLKTYLVGFALAVLLTLIPFALVARGALPLVPTLVVIAILGVTQATVHLHYFLHLDLSAQHRENLLTLAFTAVVIIIMIGGTIWTLFNLHYRMMI